MQKQGMRWLDEEAVVRRPVFPLKVVHHSDNIGFTIATTLGTSSGIISAIRVQDIKLDKWFNWDRDVGWHDPAVEPSCTPGKNLYIAMFACNIGADGMLTLTISDDIGYVIGHQTHLLVHYYNGDLTKGVGVETGTVYMPARGYVITVTVIP